MGANSTKTRPTNATAPVKPRFNQPRLNRSRVNDPDHYDYCVKVVIVGPNRISLFNQISNLGKSSHDSELSEPANQNLDFAVVRLNLPGDFNSTELAVYKFQLWHSYDDWAPGLFKGATIILVAGAGSTNDHLVTKVTARPDATGAIVALVCDQGPEIVKTLTNSVISYYFDFNQAKQVQWLIQDLIKTTWTEY